MPYLLDLGHELWVVPNRKYKLLRWGFLLLCVCRASVLTVLLLCIGRSQLRGFGCLIRIPPGCLWRHIQLEGFPLGRSRAHWGIIYPIWPGNASGSPSRSWRKKPGRRASGLFCLPCYCTSTQTQTQISSRQWMDTFCFYLYVKMFLGWLGVRSVCRFALDQSGVNVVILVQSRWCTVLNCITTWLMHKDDTVTGYIDSWEYIYPRFIFIMEWRDPVSNIVQNCPYCTVNEYENDVGSHIRNCSYLNKLGVL